MSKNSEAEGGLVVLVMGGIFLVFLLAAITKYFVPLLALAAAVRDGALPPGARVVVGAIGAGLTWGATTVTWGSG